MLVAYSVGGASSRAGASGGARAADATRMVCCAPAAAGFVVLMMIGVGRPVKPAGAIFRICTGFVSPGCRRDTSNERSYVQVFITTKLTKTVK